VNYPNKAKRQILHKLERRVIQQKNQDLLANISYLDYHVSRYRNSQIKWIKELIAYARSNQEIAIDNELTINHFISMNMEIIKYIKKKE